MALSELVARLMRLARSGQPVATALADRRLDDALEAAAAGNHDRACAICEEMVERFPRHAAGHRLLGMLRARSGEPGAALPHLERAAILAPDWPDAYLALGNVQQLLRNAPAAEASYRKALALDPAAAGAHYNLALLLRSTGRRNEALQAFRRAHELDPGRGETTWDLVQALLDIGRLDEARAAAERTLALDEQSAGAQKARGLAHLFVHEAPQALECFRRATAMAPADAEAWLHAGLAARELGQLEEALIAYEKVLTLRPGDVLARWHRSLVLLLQGEFERAWTDYEARLLSETWPRQGFPQPRWQGEALAGKTLLVHAEQGLGDEIMFASCLPEVIAQAGRCVIDCHPKLVLHFRAFVSRGLGARRPPVGRSVVARGLPGGRLSDPGRLRWRCTRAAAPAIFPATVDTFAPIRRKVAAWKERLAGLGAGAQGRTVMAGRHAGLARRRCVR